MQDNGLSKPDLLREEYTIDTPENVTFGYTIAGIGSRFIGCLVDTTILVVLLLLLNIGISLLLAWLGDNAPAQPLDAEPTPDWITGLLIAIYALINFGIIWGYYMAFEMLWNGQTPGKRLANTQVVRANGAPAEFSEVAIRNVIRIIDFLPFAYAIGFVVMFLNRRSRRLGDFAANTLVIKRQDQIKLSDLGSPVPAARGAITPAAPAEAPGSPATVSPETLSLYPNLSHMTEDDYQLVREALARNAAGVANGDLLRRLAAAMAVRVGAKPPATDQYSSRLFLSWLADAYRAASSQRSDSPPAA